MDTAALDAISSEASAPAPGAPIAVAGEPAAPPGAPGVLDAAAACAEIPAAFGSVLCMALPELRDAYSPENCHRWGEAFAKVAKKHGWDIAAIIGPYLGLALATVPMLVPTVLAVRARRAAPAPAASPASPVPDLAAAGEASSGPPKVKPL